MVGSVFGKRRKINLIRTISHPGDSCRANPSHLAVDQEDGGVERGEIDLFVENQGHLVDGLVEMAAILAGWCMGPYVCMGPALDKENRAGAEPRCGDLGGIEAG